jgi:hypothetical protein
MFKPPDAGLRISHRLKVPKFSSGDFVFACWQCMTKPHRQEAASSGMTGPTNAINGDKRALRGFNRPKQMVPPAKGGKF